MEVEAIMASQEDNLPGSDKEERGKVAEMRAFVDSQDPDAKEVDNLMLRRFLRARDKDIEKASALFLKYIEWKRTALPNGFISESEIQNELSQKKVFVQGFDKSGRPIVVGFAARHYASKRDIDELKRYFIYILEKLCASMPKGEEKFLCIADLKGWGYSNFDIPACLAAIEIMQNRYPERLGKAYLLHAPYIFNTAWNVIYPFIDNNTKKKFIFVEDKKLKETLLEDIDESQLAEVFGGKLKLLPVEEFKFADEMTQLATNFLEIGSCQP